MRGRGRPRKSHSPKKQIDLEPNQLNFISRTIIRALIRHDDCWPFLESITPKKIKMPNYYEIVTHPIGLRVIKKRLIANNYYVSAADVIRDIFLVFENAYKVSEPHSRLTKMANNLERLFRAYLKIMPHPEVEIVKNGNACQNDQPVRPSSFISSADAMV